MSNQEEIKSLLKKVLALMTKEDNLNNRPNWVKAKEVFATTIFTNKEELRQAREKKYITQYKDKENHIWYDLNSVATEFKKQQSA